MKTIMALSPLDGRYVSQTDPLRRLFSEYGLMHHRLLVELAWWRTLLQMREFGHAPVSRAALKRLEQLGMEFTPSQAEEIKAIEAETRHDVKALEYWMQRQIADVPELARATSIIHFSCTSEDINNLAYALMLATARQFVLLPRLHGLHEKLQVMAHNYAQLPMLSRTHGQGATPTTLGKEMANFAHRLHHASRRFAEYPLSGKFNGAVGNYNAHVASCPSIDWLRVNQKFVENFNLSFNAYTTQIEPHDTLANYLDDLARINTILLDLCRDFWLYISQDYFSQQVRPKEVGSSTMPHKVNPIDFENAEGNLGVANALLRHMADKLPVSRLQRDLSDSTVMRNLGTALGHSLLAFHSLEQGLARVVPNEKKIAADLEQSWSVLSEAVQTVLRHFNDEKGYERMKEMTRGKPLTKHSYLALVDVLKIPQKEKERLAKLTPATYLGYAGMLAKKYKQKISQAD